MVTRRESLSLSVGHSSRHPISSSALFALWPSLSFPGTLAGSPALSHYLGRKGALAIGRARPPRSLSLLGKREYRPVSQSPSGVAVSLSTTFSFSSLRHFLSRFFPPSSFAYRGAPITISSVCAFTARTFLHVIAFLRNFEIQSLLIPVAIQKHTLIDRDDYRNPAAHSSGYCGYRPRWLGYRRTFSTLTPNRKGVRFHPVGAILCTRDPFHGAVHYRHRSFVANNACIREESWTFIYRGWLDVIESLISTYSAAPPAYRTLTNTASDSWSVNSQVNN